MCGDAIRDRLEKGPVGAAVDLELADRLVLVTHCYKGSARLVGRAGGRAEDEAQPVMADMVAGSALGRMIDADEVAAVVEVLVSPVASAVTGTDVLVDGGAVAAFRS